MAGVQKQQAHTFKNMLQQNSASKYLKVRYTKKILNNLSFEVLTLLINYMIKLTQATIQGCPFFD